MCYLQTNALTIAEAVVAADHVIFRSIERNPFLVLRDLLTPKAIMN